MLDSRGTEFCQIRSHYISCCPKLVHSNLPFNTRQWYFQLLCRYLQTRLDKFHLHWTKYSRQILGKRRIAGRGRHVSVDCVLCAFLVCIFGPILKCDLPLFPCNPIRLFTRKEFPVYTLYTSSTSTITPSPFPQNYHFWYLQTNISAKRIATKLVESGTKVNQ